WRPPLSPVEVIASEREHLQRRFELPALVSLTDHDTIEGTRAVRASGDDIPISVEWTVPYDRSVFHLGVHGLNPAEIDGLMTPLAAYTKGAAPDRCDELSEILTWLNECPTTVVVLNHPHWDLLQVGQPVHDAALLAFLQAHGDRIHALELNGHR